MVDRAETISAGEAAELLEVTRRRITGMAEAGEITGAHKDKGGRWRIPRPEVDRLIGERRHDTREKPGRKQKEDTGSTELVEVLNRQIEDLRADRDAWREQARRTDYLLGGALERTRELESRLRELEAPAQENPSEARKSPESPGPTRAPTEAPAGPPASTQSPVGGLLRRFFRR